MRQPKTQQKKNIDGDSNTMPEDFPKLIYDLINDILFTFPEYKENLNSDLFNIKESQDENSIKNVYEHFKKVLPERFFDILYKNNDMFEKEDINTEFLPGIDFKLYGKKIYQKKLKKLFGNTYN